MWRCCVKDDVWVMKVWCHDDLYLPAGSTLTLAVIAAFTKNIGSKGHVLLGCHIPKPPMHISIHHLVRHSRSGYNVIQGRLLLFWARHTARMTWSSSNGITDPQCAISGDIRHHQGVCSGATSDEDAIFCAFLWVIWHQWMIQRMLQVADRRMVEKLPWTQSLNIIDL